MTAQLWRIIAVALIVVGGIIFASSFAKAGHLGIPSVGQERNERIWYCGKEEGFMDKLRMYYGTGIYKNAGRPATVWYGDISLLQDVCGYIPVGYIVVEIVETVIAPRWNEDTQDYGPDKTFYLLKIKDAADPTGDDYYIVTH